jgi:hypothetical protein
MRRVRGEVTATPHFRHRENEQEMGRSISSDLVACWQRKFKIIAEVVRSAVCGCAENIA